MGTGAITQYVDVAQLVLYLFWAFFFGIIYYLVRENHREGYPMETETGRTAPAGWPIPVPKTYLLAHGGSVDVPPGTPSTRQLALEPAHAFAGAPYVPTGINPMLDGVGPGAWAERADVPDLTHDGAQKIVPLRSSAEFGVSANDTDPRGLPVVGADGEVGGTVVDMWLDTSEMLFRYIEVQPTGSVGRVLVPMNFARVKSDRVRVRSVLGAQLAHVPATRAPDTVTFLEEEKIMGYFGAGTLYATPARSEPAL